MIWCQCIWLCFLFARRPLFQGTQDEDLQQVQLSLCQPFDNGMLLTSKDDLGLGLNELGIGILGSLASIALSLELELVQSFPTFNE
jgi:hypothetical protein